MKYLLAEQNRLFEINNTLNSFPECSGCYNWVNVFEGQVGYYDYVKEDLEKYDVVHINMVPASFARVVDAHNRLKNSSTKLVLNNDYLPEVWGKWKEDPMLYFNLQKLGDCVFGTEPIQTSQMIDGAFCIPHPTNTRQLRLFKSKGSNYLSVIYNNYDRNLYHTSLMTQRLKEEFKFKAKLLNYAKQNELHDYCKTYFDKIKGQIPFKEWIMELCTSKFAYVPHLYHGYNRAGVELACLGVPTVGSDRSYSLNVCFPDTVCNPLDFKKTRELFQKLHLEDEFREKISKQAREKAEFFNYANSKQRFLEMLESVKK